MSGPIFSTVAKHAVRNTSRLAPLKEKKSVVLAFGLPILFGVFGVLYLGSLLDFFIVLAVVICGMVLSASLAAPILWLFCSIYSVARVIHSNRAIDAASKHTDDDDRTPPPAAAMSSSLFTSSSLPNPRRGVKVIGA